MQLIFLIAVLCLIAGIGVQFDSMPSNDGAGKRLAVGGALVALLSGGALLLGVSL